MMDSSENHLSLSTSSRYTSLREDNDVEERLPLWRKICFAVGGAPYQITCTVIAFFLNIFLLEVAQLQPRYVSIILFSGKAWDAVTDPSIGILVLKTNTRWGSMRPWILFSAPLACASYFLLFYVPWEIVEEDVTGIQTVDASDGVKLAYYFTMFCLFEGLLSCLHVPYTALTMYVATKQEDRDSITAFRMGFEALGVLVAVVVQGLFVSGERCTGKDGDMIADGNIDNQRDAYFKGSIVVVCLYILCCLVVFFGTKEKRGVVSNRDEHESFWSGIKLVFSFKPFVWASLTFLFLSIAIAIAQGNVALYCTHTLKMGDQFSHFIFVLLIVSILAIPFWQFMIGRIGKKSTYAAGLILLIPVTISQLYLPAGAVWLYYIVMVLSGLGISVMLLLPWSLLPDVLDLYMLEKNTRHDSIFYSFYVFFNKLAAGIALGLSQIVLEFSGYLTGECQQPDEVGYALRLLVTPGPVLMLLLALFSLYKYPIDETRRRQIKQGVLKLVVDYNEQVVESTSQSYNSLARNVSERSHVTETNA